MIKVKIFCILMNFIFLLCFLQKCAWHICCIRRHQVVHYNIYFLVIAICDIFYHSLLNEPSITFIYNPFSDFGFSTKETTVLSVSTAPMIFKLSIAILYKNKGACSFYSSSTISQKQVGTYAVKAEMMPSMITATRC